LEGNIIGSATMALRAGRNGSVPEPSAAKTEQRNTAITYGDKFILKLFRHIEPGMHPALESARFLASKKFPHVPPLAGSLEFHRADGQQACLGIMSGFIPATDGWRFTQDALRRYFDRVRTLPAEAREDYSMTSLVELAEKGASPAAMEIIGTYFDAARLM